MLEVSFHDLKRAEVRKYKKFLVIELFDDKERSISLFIDSKEEFEVLKKAVEEAEKYIEEIENENS